MELIDWFVSRGPEVAYLILFVGSLVEGESFVLTAGYLAYKGFLTFPNVVILAFFGSWIADQMLYFIGRFYGPGIIRRFPSWKPASDKAFRLLHTYKTSFIFFFRFVYGIRTVSPLMIGASGISVARFTTINTIAAVVWSIVSVSAGYAIGYYFSHEIEAGFVFVRKWFTYVIGVGLLLLFGYLFYRRHATGKSSQKP